MLEVVLYAPEMLEGMRRVLFRMFEAVQGEFCLLEELDVMRCVLICILEAVEGGLCLREEILVGLGGLGGLEGLVSLRGAERAGRAGGEALVYRYSACCGGFEISIAAVFSLQSPTSSIREGMLRPMPCFKMLAMAIHVLRCCFRITVRGHSCYSTSRLTDSHSTCDDSF